MPNVSSSLGTSQAYIPLVNSTQLGKAAGFAIMFPTAAALQTALTTEKTNIANTTPLWAEGQVLSDSSMPPSVVRIWNATSPGHARRVVFPDGHIITLTSDTNVVLPITGVPGSGVGANGDVAVDITGNAFYTKTSGSWAKTGFVITTDNLLGSYVNAKQFGAKGDGTTDDTTALQNAINFCQTNATTLYIPNKYKISATLNVTSQISIVGANMMQSQILPAVTSGVSFTAIAINQVDVFPKGTASLANFAICYPDSGTPVITNSTLLLAGGITMDNTFTITDPNTQYPENINSRFVGVAVVGSDVGINSIRGSQWWIEACVFGATISSPTDSGSSTSTASYGVLVQNKLNADYGDSRILNCLFYGGQYGIYHISAGGLMVMGCKFKALINSFVCKFGLGLADGGYTGDTFLIGNSFEGADAGSVVIESSNSGGNNNRYGTITIVGNELCAYLNGSTALSIGENGNYLYGITIGDNTFSLSARTSAAVSGLRIGKVEGFSFIGNVMAIGGDSSGTLTPINVLSTAKNGIVGVTPVMNYLGTTTINANVNSSTNGVVLERGITGVTAGSYTNANITVGVDGKISAAANGTGGVPTRGYLNRNSDGNSIANNTHYTWISYNGTLTNTFGGDLTFDSEDYIQTYTNTSGASMDLLVSFYLNIGTAPGYWSVSFIKNGATDGSTANVFNQNSLTVPALAAGNYIVGVTAPIRLADDDYFSIDVLQITGGTVASGGGRITIKQLL